MRLVWVLATACSGTPSPPDAAPLLTVTPYAGTRTISTPAGIDCGDNSAGACSFAFAYGTHVSLAVTAQTTLPCFTFPCENIEPSTAGFACSDLVIDGPVTLAIGCVR